MNRRSFINISTIVAGSAMLIGFNPYASEKIILENANHDDEFSSTIDNITPITLEERKSRIHKAQQLMRQENIDCLLLDSGTSMRYFTGISWGSSERPMIVAIPSTGDVRYNLILASGMCFSIEPNISIADEFGVRLEDCVYMTTNNPKWFSQPSPSIDRPFA